MVIARLALGYLSVSWVAVCGEAPWKSDRRQYQRAGFSSICRDKCIAKWIDAIPMTVIRGHTFHCLAHHPWTMTMRTVNHNIVNGLHLFDGHGERCGILFSGNLPTHIYRDGGSVHVQLNVQNPDAWTIGAFFFFFFYCPLLHSGLGLNQRISDDEFSSLVGCQWVILSSSS